MASLGKWLKEARRRRVFRTAGIYIVAAWVSVQVFSEAFPAFDIPASAIRYVWIGALVGLPIAVVFGWLYDVTGSGIVRTATANTDDDAELQLRRTDFLILTALAAVASVAVFQLSGRISEQDASVEQQIFATAEAIPLAVLPLENLSNDPEQAYFVNGIHDALISDVSRISGFQVTSKTTARAYANTAKSVETVCDELAITHLIQGSVRRVNNDVEVRVQLRDCSSDDAVWSEEYNRTLSDVLIMQSEITRSIANAVQVALTREEIELLARTPAVNPAAHESYLRGMFRLELFTPQDMQLAEELFSRSLEFDPDSALAQWGLGRTCRFQLQFGLAIPLEREPECRGYQFKALAIDPDLPQVHLGLALSYWLYDYDWDAADASFLRALELNPNFAEAYMFYAHFLAHMLRWEESDLNIQRAVELDPLNTFVLGLHAAQQHLLGRLDVAVEELSRLHDEVPGFGFGYDVLWYSNTRLGNLDAAIDAAKKHYSVTMGIPSVAETIEREYAENGFDRAMLTLGAELETLAEQRYIQAVFIAMPFAIAGDAGKATEWLNVAFEQRDPMMPYIGTFSGSANISSDARFAEILSRMDLSLANSLTQ